MAQIDICDLWKSFGSKVVLKGLSLQIMEGETIVIVGRSGVGKSVLLRQILGLDHPDSGTIQINGNRISDLHGRALYEATLNMGMLFQSSALFDSLTVAENTAFWLRQHGDFKKRKRLSDDEVNARVSEALALVELEGSDDLLPSDLSGGMKKRAALARLIVYRPKIILYDEPTTGLDPITAQHINELIKRTQKELQATSIVVTHDIHSALQVGDRLALHHDGKINNIAAPDEFMKHDHPIIQGFLQNVGLD